MLIQIVEGSLQRELPVVSILKCKTILRPENIFALFNIAREQAFGNIRPINITAEYAVNDGAVLSANQADCL